LRNGFRGSVYSRLALETFPCPLAVHFDPTGRILAGGRNPRLMAKLSSARRGDGVIRAPWYGGHLQMQPLHAIAIDLGDREMAKRRQDVAGRGNLETALSGRFQSGCGFAIRNRACAGRRNFPR
jgi:hypothetical protein